MNIHYLKHIDINTKKWNDSIRTSFNGNVYAFSWYLDIVSPNWEALVNDDYSCIMPLTWKKKLGIKYLCQPFFAQQLGVFSNFKLSVSTVEEFLQAIPSKFKFIEININKFNKPPKLGFDIKQNINYELDIIKPYEKIVANYSDNTKRNIKKAYSQKIKIIEELPLEQFISFYKTNTGIKVEKLETQHYINLHTIISLAIRSRFGEILAAYTHDNILCAAVFFIFSHGKAIFLAPASTSKGREVSAMFAIVDYFIKKYAENSLTLDFEGSNIPQLARFYKGFGAVETQYFTIKKNNLPPILKWLKK